ncbi:LacI family DNA-binding transcriptional regulator [Paenibacillus ferrarius]|uniref:LacI family DNA-binding transcriptional regulator n=1 Tax=Paenibacillus ferrarius TaxID=1469647 RepID=UPI003D280511
MTRKRVTSFDVAKRAGVSRSVVSAVLNGTQGIGVSPETREAVLAAIKELNYHVDSQARAMRTGQSSCLAAFGDTGNPLFLQVLEGIQQACLARRYHILICGQEDGEARERLLELYLQNRIDGIITLDPVSYCDEKWAAEVNRLQVPYVSIEGYAENDSVISVQADYYKSVMDALAYMSRDTALPPPIYVHLHNNENLASNWAEKRREQAYTDWCANRCVEPRIERLHADDEMGLRRVLQRLQAEGAGIPPLLFNWAMGAIGTYRAAWELDLRVGEHVKLMAADDTLRVNRYLVPSLSMMEIPYAAMGAEAVAALFSQIDRGEPLERRESRFLQARLHPGESI